MSVFLGQVERMGSKSHISFNLPGHWSFEDPVARPWLESVSAWQLLQLKQNPPRVSLGSRSQSGHHSSVWSWRVPCCAGWQCQHLTPHHLLLPAEVQPLPCLLGTDLLFGSIAGVLLQTLSFASVPRLHTDRFPCASLAAPSPQHSFLTGWAGNSDLFLHLVFLVM